MKDNIYSVPRAQLGDFTFDDKVAKVFPDMIKRSVPGYSNIIQAIGMLTEKHAKPNTNLYDLGCSLGACALEMSSNAPVDCKIIGVDNSQDMIERAKKIVSASKNPDNIELVLGDITNFKLENASIVILNFVLQFITPAMRDELIANIYKSLVPGGILVLSEKFKFADNIIDSVLYELHHDFKRANGYSELEISQKRDAIENVLIPESIENHYKRLEKAGFTHRNVWFECFNFGSIIAIK
jgi:tRNA (cmo5U34)-methyltransferase